MSAEAKPAAVYLVRAGTLEVLRKVVTIEQAQKLAEAYGSTIAADIVAVFGPESGEQLRFRGVRLTWHAPTRHWTRTAHFVFDAPRTWDFTSK